MTVALKVQSVRGKKSKGARKKYSPLNNPTHWVGFGISRIMFLREIN